MQSRRSAAQPPSSSQQILDDFRRLVRLLRESAVEAERRVGISGAQLFVLQRLAARPLTVGELAQATLTHQSSVSVVVKRLEERRLVARSPNPGDARSSRIALTSKGQAIVRKSPPLAQDRLMAAVDALGPRRRKLFAALLEEVLSGAAADGTTPTMFFEESPAGGRTRSKQ